MFKKAPGPVLMVAVVAGTVALALLLCRRGSDARRHWEGPVIPGRLTYAEARAKLLRCPRWHLTDSRSTACCWVTLEPRQSEGLEDVFLSSELHEPRRDRRGIVRVEPVQGPTTKVVLDEEDTSYWRVVGEVYLAGDPALVREVAAHLAADSGP